MPRFFSDNATHVTRAQQLWQILIAAASERRILTYGGLSDLIGTKVAINHREPLYYIKQWCETNRLPPLIVIVVNKDTGKPGSGMGLDDVDQAREEVFNYAWYRLMPPTAEELKGAYNTQDAQE